MRAVSSRILVFSVLALIAAGCADGEDPVGNQSAADASVEAGNKDAGADAKKPDSSPDALSPEAGDAGADASDAPVEASIESGIDAGPDALEEASVDAAADAPGEASVDAAPEAGPEAAVDAPVEAAVEASVEAAVEAGPDADVLPAIHITEVYVDVALQGDAYEWVAISAVPGTPIDDLKLRHYKWESSSKPIVLKFDLAVAATGTVMPSSGYWVVGGFWAPSDQSYGISSWGLDSSSGSVQLYRASDLALLDAVGYGAAEPTNAPTPPLATMEGTAAALPAGGTTDYSIARKPGGTWHDNALDFCVQLATPKADNPGVCE